MPLAKTTHAPALVIEKKGELSLRDTPVRVEPAAGEVAVCVEMVGICGSDVHYYTHDRIGPFVVEAPMILGHEAAGRVVAIGPEVEGFKVGDRVCMEPGIPDPTSRASKLGIYNVDPSVTFWATPPVHGCLTPRVVHKAAFTYKLPDTVSFAGGAMVEPLAIGLQAAARPNPTWRYGACHRRWSDWYLDGALGLGGGGGHGVRVGCCAGQADDCGAVPGHCTG